MIKYEDNLTSRINGNNLQPLQGASVTVTSLDTGLPASLYSDNGVTPLAQPLTTDNNGYFGFYAPDGKYKLTFSGSRFATFTREITLDDPKDNPYATKAELAAGTGSALVTFTQAGAGAVQRTAQDRLRDVVSVKDFGAKGDGITDDTSAIQAAYSYFTSAFFGGALVFPRGNYLTKSQIVFNDLYFKDLIFDGATICGGSESASYDAVFKIVNAQRATISGALTVSADASASGPHNDPNKYTAAMALLAMPGGAINASGILNYFDINGLTATKSRVGLVIGAYDSEAQVAEMNVRGLMTPFCPMPVKVSGSQSVVSFIGSSITSSVWPAITSPTYTAMLIEGAGVSMTGGELTQHGSTAGLIVDFQPAQSPTYSNPYGAFSAVGVLIETKGPCAKVSNPRSLAAPLSRPSHISMNGCYGYSGELPTTSAFISIADASYIGKIAIDEACRFYQYSGASARTAPTIDSSAASGALISVGRRVFTDGYPHWMAGVSGGKLLHGLELAVQGFINSGTLASGGQNLKPSTLNSAPRYSRYSSIYNISTGVITIPTYGASTLRIEVSILTGGATGDIYLNDITNSRIACFGQISGGVGNLVATISDCAPGQQFAVVVNASAQITFGGSVTDHINIYIGNE